MTTNYLLDHIRPTTLAQMIAEIINDHADEDNTGRFESRSLWPILASTEKPGSVRP